MSLETIRYIDFISGPLVSKIYHVSGSLNSNFSVVIRVQRLPTEADFR